MPLLKQWKGNEKTGIKLLKVGLQLILTNAYGTNKILTENVIMAMVRSGGDRQECHEKIRVLSHEVGRNVKNGLHNDLVDRIQNEPYFSPIADQLKGGAAQTAGLFDPSTFIGRAPEQVDEFIKNEVEEILQKYDEQALKEQVQLRV